MWSYLGGGGGGGGLNVRCWFSPFSMAQHFVRASNRGPDETAHMRRLVRRSEHCCSHRRQGPATHVLAPNIKVTFKIIH